MGDSILDSTNSLSKSSSNNRIENNSKQILSSFFLLQSSKLKWILIEQNLIWVNNNKKINRQFSNFVAGHNIRELPNSSVIPEFTGIWKLSFLPYAKLFDQRNSNSSLELQESSIRNEIHRNSESNCNFSHYWISLNVHRAELFAIPSDLDSDINPAGDCDSHVNNFEGSGERFWARH